MQKLRVFVKTLTKLFQKYFPPAPQQELLYFLLLVVDFSSLEQYSVNLVKIPLFKYFGTQAQSVA